jgi:hypothetical protein
MQIGKLLGAKVVAVARGNEKCALLSQLGADLVVDSVTRFFNTLLPCLLLCICASRQRRCTPVQASLCSLHARAL